MHWIGTTSFGLNQTKSGGRSADVRCEERTHAKAMTDITFAGPELPGTL